MARRAITQGNAVADEVEVVVIGAGVVGLAVARQLARCGREVIVVEAASAVGTEISSRNSEVVHAGIYYPAGSRKAELCVRGRHRLYAYCDERGIPHRRCGKLIVATDDAQVPVLSDLAGKARVNGVDDMQFLGKAEAHLLEPEVHSVAALYSPSSGIVDTHAFMLALRGEAEDNGAMFAFNTPLAGGEVANDGIALDFGGNEPMTLKARFVVNAAGLSAPSVAGSISGVPSDSIPTPRFAKGNYFKLEGRAPFSRLVYPVPEPGGLGVHATLDMAGQVRFGPDVEWIESVDYAVNAERSRHFYARIRQYWPGLRDGALSPDYCGVRPKIEIDGAIQNDFVISGPAEHGVAGLVNLYGIESPGLTASLALAELVDELVEAVPASTDFSTSDADVARSAVR
jgi:L-2-hydroxyglutarate oxidase LhgO